MIQSSRSFRSSLLASLLCGVSAASLFAQNPSDQSPGGDQHHAPRPNALFDALDTNHDGVISAEEMANASTALKALLKNGATQITRADLRPSSPPPRHAEQAENAPRPDAETSHPQNPPPSNQAANGPATPRLPMSEDQVDHPPYRLPFYMDKEAMAARLRHRLQEAGYADRFAERARQQDERAENPQRPPFGLDERSDRPGARNWQRFQNQGGNQEGEVSAEEVDRALATLKKLEHELYQLRREDQPFGTVPQRRAD